MVDEVAIRKTVEAGGGIYRFTMNLDDEVLVNFDASVPLEIRSTMCLRLRDLTPDNVRRQIEKQQLEFRNSEPHEALRQHR